MKINLEGGGLGHGGFWECGKGRNFDKYAIECYYYYHEFRQFSYECPKKEKGDKGYTKAKEEMLLMAYIEKAPKRKLGSLTQGTVIIGVGKSYFLNLMGYLENLWSWEITQVLLSWAREMYGFKLLA